MALTLDGDNGVSGVNGSAGTPALQGTDTNTGISFGTDTVNLVTGGSNRFVVGSAGQFGIGGATYGSSGQVLTSQGSSSAPQWATVSTADSKIAAFVSFNATQTIDDSFNVSSVTNLATGRNEVAYTSNLGTNAYSVFVSASQNGNSAANNTQTDFYNRASGDVGIATAASSFANLATTSVLIMNN